jgi:hypothetical protein
MWEVFSEDFIYCCALSEGLDYCAHAGTSRTLVVLSGRTGAQLFRVGFSSTIWSVQICSTLDGPKLAVGGEAATLSVFDIASRQVQLELPLEGELYSICFSRDSICYTNGACAFMYGAGGTRHSWDDRPSFSVVTELIASLVGDEQSLYRCMNHLVTRHPSVINMCPQSEQKPEHGPSLVHWAVENTSSNKLLELLLSASCGVGLLPDGNGRTAIHAAIEHSKLFHMRLLSTAIVEGRFTMLPGPMRAVTATFPIWAAKFPADFLAIVSSMQMQAEPEVLGGIETQGVMLPRMLIRGSNWRCPKQTLWAEDLERYRPLDDDDLPFWPMMMGQPGGPSSVVSGASTVNEGFSKVNLGGVQAWRVPFECFAGIVGDEDEEGAAEDDQQAVSVLQLLLRAVAETKDYACFDSMPLEVMLQYKWVAFGRRIYIRQCLAALFDFVLTVWYNKVHTSNRWGERWIDTLDESGQASSSERTIPIISVCGFCWTTLVALRRGGSAVSSMKQRYMRRETVFETDRVLMLVASASSIITNGFVLYARTNPDAVADSATVVIGAAESDSADGWLTFEAMQFMHALTILAFTLRLCFFSLRGFLRFGALIHMVFVVVIDIMPFMVLLGFMILGFSLALSLVTTDREGSLLSTHGFLSALSTTVDMGLYAASIQPQVMHEPSVFVLYFPFMLLVQVVLLNLVRCAATTRCCPRVCSPSPF